MGIDYKAVLAQVLQEFGVIIKERQELDLKIAQKLQFIRATMNQLADHEKGEFEDWLQKLVGVSAGLSDSIRTVLRENPRKWHTATQVRDALIKLGFDFGNYASNPLASVHSALKRLKQDEAETDTIDAVMVWRWNSTDQPRRRFRHRNPFAMSAPTGQSDFWRNVINKAVEEMPKKNK